MQVISTHILAPKIDAHYIIEIVIPSAFVERSLRRLRDHFYRRIAARTWCAHIQFVFSIQFRFCYRALRFCVYKATTKRALYVAYIIKLWVYVVRFCVMCVCTTNNVALMCLLRYNRRDITHTHKYQEKSHIELWCLGFLKRNEQVCRNRTSVHALFIVNQGSASKTIDSRYRAIHGGRNDRNAALRWHWAKKCKA